MSHLRPSASSRPVVHTRGTRPARRRRHRRRAGGSDRRLHDRRRRDRVAPGRDADRRRGQRSRGASPLAASHRFVRSGRHLASAPGRLGRRHPRRPRPARAPGRLHAVAGAGRATPVPLRATGRSATVPDRVFRRRAGDHDDAQRLRRCALLAARRLDGTAKAADPGHLQHRRLRIPATLPAAAARAPGSSPPISCGCGWSGSG